MEYYVYTHSKPDGSIFYVGKGPLKRAKYLVRKSNQWHTKTVQKYGKENITVDYIKCESEQDALLLEMEAIEYLRSVGHKLVNLTLGGEGPNGLQHTADTKLRISKKLKGTNKPKGFAEKVSARVRGTGNPMHGRVKTSEERAAQSAKVGGLNNGRADKTQYKFLHSTGIEFVGTQYELRKLYNIEQSCMAHLMRGRYQSTMGWKCLGKI